MEIIEQSFLFDIIIRVLITAYGATWVWNFMAYTPWGLSDDDFFQFNEFNYTFWLISSLIFLWLWTLQFKYPILVYLSLLEMIILLITYMFLIAKKQKCIKLQRKMRTEMKRKKLEMLNTTKNKQNLKK